MMAEELEVQFEGAIALQAHDPTHLLEKLWLAVRRQSHDFVFVAVVRKAEILGERRIKDSERVGEINAAIDPNAVRSSDAPSDAGEITEAIHGKHDRVGKRRYKIGGREVCQVMFDVMNFGFNCVAGKCPA